MLNIKDNLVLRLNEILCDLMWKKKSTVYLCLLQQIYTVGWPEVVRQMPSTFYYLQCFVNKSLFLADLQSIQEAVCPTGLIVSYLIKNVQCQCV